MSTNVKADIIAAIARTEDNGMKVVLLMLLAVLDEISAKIDDRNADEAGLRAAVLNGHAPVHSVHHEYIDRHIKFDEVDFSHRQWVADKIAEEEERERANKESRRDIRDDLIKNLLWALVVVAAGSGWFLK